MAVTQDPPQFVRVTFGHERLSPSDSNADLKRTAEALQEFNEKQLDKAVKEFRRLVKDTTPKLPESKVRARAKKKLAN